MNQLITQEPNVQIVTATKKLVDSLLVMNTHNRSVKTANIKRILSDLASGNFMLTGSGMSVSKTGVLLDGQNRLMAIKEAGYPPVKFILATGLDTESQRVIDRHAKRNLSDVITLHMNKTVSTAVVAAVHATQAFGATKGKSFAFAPGKSILTDTEVIDFIADHGDLLADVVSASQGAKAPVLAALFVYALHDRVKAIEFSHAIAKGLDLQEDHPAYRLRLFIARTKSMNAAPGRFSLFKNSASAICSDANGKKIKLLREVDSWSSAPWSWVRT